MFDSIKLVCAIAFLVCIPAKSFSSGITDADIIENYKYLTLVTLGDGEQDYDDGLLKKWNSNIQIGVFGEDLEQKKRLGEHVGGVIGLLGGIKELSIELKEKGEVNTFIIPLGNVHESEKYEPLIREFVRSENDYLEMLESIFEASDCRFYTLSESNRISNLLIVFNSKEFRSYEKNQCISRGLVSGLGILYAHKIKPIRNSVFEQSAKHILPSAEDIENLNILYHSDVKLGMNKSQLKPIIEKLLLAPQ